MTLCIPQITTIYFLLSPYEMQVNDFHFWLAKGEVKESSVYYHFLKNHINLSTDFNTHPKKDSKNIYERKITSFCE